MLLSEIPLGHSLPRIFGLLILLLPLASCGGGSGAGSDEHERVRRFGAAWEAFHAYMAETHPDIDFRLNPGTDDIRIDTYQKKIGKKFPPEMRELYRRANGQSADGFALFPEYDFDSLEESTAQAESMNGLSLFFLRFLPGEGDPGVKNRWWHRRWAPIGANGAGDLFCIDLAPASGGTYGQVITFIHDDSHRSRYASGLTQLFDNLRTGLENGDWVIHREWQVFLDRRTAREYGYTPEAPVAETEPEAPIDGTPPPESPVE